MVDESVEGYFIAEHLDRLRSKVGEVAHFANVRLSEISLWPPVAMENELRRFHWFDNHGDLVV